MGLPPPESAPSRPEASPVSGEGARTVPPATAARLPDGLFDDNENGRAADCLAGERHPARNRCLRSHVARALFPLCGAAGAAIPDPAAPSAHPSPVSGKDLTGEPNGARCDASARAAVTRFPYRRPRQTPIRPASAAAAAARSGRGAAPRPDGETSGAARATREHGGASLLRACNAESRARAPGVGRAPRLLGVDRIALWGAAPPPRVAPSGRGECLVRGPERQKASARHRLAGGGTR
jgi:hypothetical protein